MPDNACIGAEAPHTDAIVEQLLDGLAQAARDIAPEFIRTMPQAYFDDTTEDMRLAHVKAIIAAETSGIAQTVTLRDADGHHFTFISNCSYPGQLGEFVKRLPYDRPLTSAKVYTSEQGNRVLDIFHFGEHVAYDPAHPGQSARVAEVQRFIEGEGRAGSTVAHHFASCDGDYLCNTPPEQVYRHFQLVEQVRREGSQQVRLERYHDPAYDRLTLVFAEQDPRLLFERISKHLGRNAIDIHRAYLDSFQDADDDITLLTFIIEHQQGSRESAHGAWEQMAFDLRRLAHLDTEVFPLAQNVTDGDLLAAELLLALSRLAHQNLVKRDSLLFTRERIVAILQRYPELARQVSTCFRQRFMAGGDASERSFSELRATIARDTGSDDAGIVFDTLLDAVSATLRTNLFLPERRALALRLAPSFFAGDGREEVPFGVFYVHGLHFDGFHVRFRDIARGGVRIVRPRGQEQYALETERHFDEAYGLANAQQHKNKDIPEGGSKGVVLAVPEADFDRVGRAYADALLDLIIPDGQLNTLHADYYGRDELLYLGPDENISNQLITWVVERARQRGHPMPDAFMSSKPTAGINHKEYGVTSEGVTVFLEHALRAAGIDPRRQPFTIKMTGGPDGDVAGNEILILEREFADRVRILGIADGSGIAEDPGGLDMGELGRLVRSELPISQFDRSRLGSQGRVVGVDEPGGINLRNTMHNRIVADAFIPAGGRPNTINGANWASFMDADGNPSARVIVEGANLFITPEARLRLSELGVIIIKDSSANKCGVICSSYEIMASMLLDPQAFLGIKSQFVAEVLERLRLLAGLEARALFREHQHKPQVHLPDLSVRLSRAITRATDAVSDSIAGLQSAHPELLRELVIGHLPPSLYQKSGERTFERIPAAYLNRVIASNLASRIVYREGLDWFESMAPEAIACLAGQYLVEDAAVQQLVSEVRDSQLVSRDRIARLLENGGVAGSLRSSDT